MNHIFWPEGFVPGFTENFASNEVIVAGLSAAEIWPFLANPSQWPSYYTNSANVRFYVGSSRVDLQACKLEYSIVSPK